MLLKVAKLCTLVLFLKLQSAQSFRDVKSPIIEGRPIGVKRIDNNSGNVTYENTGEHPYMVGILFEGDHICGGSILSESVVLTAAHCMEIDASNYHVRAGSLKRMDSNDALLQYREVSHYKHHPEFNSSSYLANDVALLWIKKKFEFSKFVNKINLADKYDSYQGEKLINLGWGITEEDISSEYLRKVELTVISTESCRKYYENFIGVKITSATVCAIDIEEYKRGSCFHDSGGPLVKHNSEGSKSDVLVGVSSFMADGCNTTFPFGFVHVGHIKSWVLQELKQVM